VGRAVLFYPVTLRQTRLNLQFFAPIRKNMRSDIQDYRRSPRMLCSSLLGVVLNGEFGGETMVVGVVEDISERGLCLSLDAELEPGCQVVLHSIEQAFRAIVRHCTADELGGFHVGFEFSDSSKWDTDDSWPEHRAPFGK
jgi:hypothetical protein